MAEFKGTPKGHMKRHSFIAHSELERMGINPIEWLADVYLEAMQGYKSGRGITEKGDGGAAWLAVAGKAAADLCSYKHPKLSAIAISDLSKDQARNEREAISTEQAIAIFKADPFATDQIRKLDTGSVIDAMKSTIKKPALPIGEGNDVST